MGAGIAEQDPHGLDTHTPGAKLDAGKARAGKARAGLVLGGFPQALMAVAEVGTFGARKYSPGGWAHVSDGVARYTDAMWRHVLAEAAGEALDAQTGIAHAAHTAWNALARLELLLRAVGSGDAATNQ